ncbi:MAG: DUF4160 domain-containing protein [Pirellulaceae bacterium]|nr:DUF4160 domain-containing protein [Pirellulaceae bacterium]
MIRMYYRDHNPPHFHAEYGESEITVDIDTGSINGRFPKRALAATLEWLDINRNELEQNWQLARDSEPLRPIPPLE